MANRRMEFLIGMTVLVVFATIIVMTILFGSNQTSLFQFKQGQRMSILFNKAPGIKNTSRVTKSGVEIGRVVRTDLVDSENSAQVRVFFTLNDPKTRIFSNEQARIKPSLLMGESEIEFVKNPAYRGEVREMTPSDQIRGVSGNDIMGTVGNIEGDLKTAIESINETAKEATAFIEKVNLLIGDEGDVNIKKQNIENVFRQLESTLGTTSKLAENMNEIISDPNIRKNILKGAEDFPNILNKVNSLLDHGEELYVTVKDMVASSKNTMAKFDRSLGNVESFTQILSEDGKSFIQNMNASSEDITKMVGNISTLSEEIVEQIGNKETPLGMLTDEDVGRRVRGIVRNVESATEKVQPILDDARVFTNKIAHRPSALVFSRDTYKGAPALSDSRYSYQPYSPAGGIGSKLWTETRARAPQAPSAGGHEYYPGSLESYQASYPETYAELQRQKPLGSCLSGGGPLGKPLFSRENAQEMPQAGYTSDPGAYYGLEGVVPVEGDMYAGGYYSGSMPVSGENRMDVPQEGGLCGMKFSLTRAFRKVFKGDEEPAGGCPLQSLRPAVPAGVPMIGALCGGDTWNPAEGIPAETISWAPGGEELVFDGECAAPACEIPSCEAPSCETGCALPGGGGNLSEPLPAQKGYLPTESPLPERTGGTARPELPTEKPQAEAPSTLPPGATEELPASAIRRSAPANGYQPSGVSPGYTNNAGGAPLPAPIKSKKRDFVDDGLPLRWAPNE